MMTQDELFSKHMEAVVNRKDHVPISIQYAIGILEELCRDRSGHVEDLQDGEGLKLFISGAKTLEIINELKKLLV